MIVCRTASLLVLGWGAILCFLLSLGLLLSCRLGVGIDVADLICFSFSYIDLLVLDYRKY